MSVYVDESHENSTYLNTSIKIKVGGFEKQFFKKFNKQELIKAVSVSVSLVFYLHKKKFQSS